MSELSLLRFITAGSVDDGKSTLIGRLLYDSKSLMHDQLASLENDNPDFASLTDGLSAEREQGITIDVAYRYFSTPKRKFIIADTPGHEQYTRNMVTGASTADAAIVLIDSTRIKFNDNGAELLVQTKRHSAILRLLNIRHIIIAVNKLDLINFSEEKYKAIISAYEEIADKLQITQFHAVPISALGGDNIVEKSANTPWYQGPSLLELLEQLPLESYKNLSQAPLIFPIQRVVRQDGSQIDDFRGYQGRIEQGRLEKGQTIKTSPQGQSAKIKTLYGINGEQNEAHTGEHLTIVLEEDIDLSRGDCLISTESTEASRNLYASLCWFDQTPMNPTRRYIFKQGPTSLAAKIKSIDLILDPNSLLESNVSTHALNINDIARIQLTLQRPILSTSYEQNRRCGSFILIDELSNQTVAAGMIRASENPKSDEWSI